MHDAQLGLDGLERLLRVPEVAPGFASYRGQPADEGQFTELRDAGGGPQRHPEVNEPVRREVPRA